MKTFIITNNIERAAIYTWMAIMGIIVFVLVFFSTQLILSEYEKAYGQETNITEYHELLRLDNAKDLMTPDHYQIVKNSILEGPYAQTIRVTADAANQTEGYTIDQYIEYIKNQTCPTIIKESYLRSECYR